MNRANESAEFERWLDRELPGAIAAELGAVAQPPPLVVSRRSLGRRGAAASVVLAFGLAAAGGLAALATGSLNPVSWGNQVIQAVSVGALAPQPTPAPLPPARPAVRPSAPVTSERPTTDGAVQDSDGNAGRAKQQGHDGGSPPPDQDRTPKPHGHAQGQNQ